LAELKVSRCQETETVPDTARRQYVQWQIYSELYRAAGCERFAKRVGMFLCLGQGHSVKFGGDLWPFGFVGADDEVVTFGAMDYYTFAFSAFH